MDLRTAGFAIAALLTAGQTVPSTKAIVSAVSTYVSQYQREFIALVADERVTQRVSERGAVTATREWRGELFSAFVDDERRWMSVHDIQRVDGQPVDGREDVRSLLRTQSLREIGPRLAAQNARFNLGHVSRNFNEPTLALLLFTREHVGNLSVKRDGTPVLDHDRTVVTLQVILDKSAPLVRGLTRRVDTRGTLAVEPETGRIRRTICGSMMARCRRPWTRDTTSIRT